MTKAKAANHETNVDVAIIDAYAGAGEGCAGQLTAAKTDLDAATAVLGALTSDDRDNITPRCGVDDLVSWAYYTYLDRDVTLPCTASPASTTTVPATTTVPSAPSTSGVATTKPRISLPPITRTVPTVSTTQR